MNVRWERRKLLHRTHIHLDMSFGSLFSHLTKGRRESFLPNNDQIISSHYIRFSPCWTSTKCSDANINCNYRRALIECSASIYIDREEIEYARENGPFAMNAHLRRLISIFSTYLTTKRRRGAVFSSSKLSSSSHTDNECLCGNKISVFPRRHFRVGLWFTHHWQGRQWARRYLLFRCLHAHAYQSSTMYNKSAHPSTRAMAVRVSVCQSPSTTRREREECLQTNCQNTFSLFVNKRTLLTSTGSRKRLPRASCVIALLIVSNSLICCYCQRAQDDSIGKSVTSHFRSDDRRTRATYLSRAMKMRRVEQWVKNDWQQVAC